MDFYLEIKGFHLAFLSEGTCLRNYIATALDFASAISGYFPLPLVV